MNKFINLIFLSLVLGSGAVAEDNIFTNAKVAIQKIEKNDIQFIASQKSEQLIRGSKVVNPHLLSSDTILGKMPCSPFYSCPKQVEAYFSSLGIIPTQSLILYDNSYGVYASVLYTILESFGHKNMTILNGGTSAVKKLDPNQKLFDKYLNEIKAVRRVMQEDNSSVTQKKSEATIKSLITKIEMVQPHLLIEKNLNFALKKRSNYVIKEQNRNYLLSTKELQNAVSRVRSKESNLTLIDACPMVDIVGNRYGNYLLGVTPLSWKRLIDRQNNSLQAKDELENIFIEMKLKKEDLNYLYCMSESSKALFMMLVMRELGYTNVKAYTGNWSVWKGEGNE